MEYFIALAYPWLAVVLIFCVVGTATYVWQKRKSTRVAHSFVALLYKNGYRTSLWYKGIPFAMRLFAMLMLALLTARLQLVNRYSKVTTNGVDIYLLLDASGSMQCFDDIQDQRSRFVVAKKEAIDFIEKRVDDQVGLIIFGKDAISRCPLTLDKRVVIKIIEQLELGAIDPDGTVLSTAICMGVKRLKNSQACSKIMIVLTDGEPTPGLDINHEDAIALAKKCGIKIYTIGIGGEHGGLWHDPLFGIRPMGFRLNKALLEYFARQTGGKFYMAQHPDDLKTIYEEIDRLEKTQREEPIYTQYVELIALLCMLIVLCLLAELIATTFIWFCL